ncbi:MAG: hypothetical protein CMI52_04340 [Parcubacteria group bacterium]|nr:hypothetical protein [Parcubacteria group bacterium]|tara:strand:+ start:461 stop:709 length:249 start_codon:yes stop_codon:yes gene_type:complete
MTDRLDKEINKLSKKEKATVKEVFNKLRSGDQSGLQIKKLRLRTDIYRVRKGKLRIIYRVVSDKIKLLAVERRSEKTYRSWT